MQILDAILPLTGKLNGTKHGQKVLNKLYKNFPEVFGKGDSALDQSAMSMGQGQKGKNQKKNNKKGNNKKQQAQYKKI